jgi:hypothetical protein
MWISVSINWSALNIIVSSSYCYNTLYDDLDFFKICQYVIRLFCRPYKQTFIVNTHFPTNMIISCSCYYMNNLQLLRIWLILQSWRWKRRVPPKHILTLNGLHSVISLKTKLFIFKFLLLYICFCSFVSHFRAHHGWLVCNISCPSKSCKPLSYSAL